MQEVGFHFWEKSGRGFPIIGIYCQLMSKFESLKDLISENSSIINCSDQSLLFESVIYL